MSPPSGGLGHLRGWRGMETLSLVQAQQMSARREQVGQGAGDNEAMRVLFEPAVTHLGEAEHPLDDPDRMLDLGPHLRLCSVLCPLDHVHHAAIAVAAIDEVARLGSMPADHRASFAFATASPLPVASPRRYRICAVE